MPETQANRRLAWLLRVLLLWIAAILGRLVWLQVIRHDDLLKQARQQQQKLREIPAQRGTIYDRDHRPLAKSLPAESICVNPQKIPDANVAADLLSRLLNLDRADLYEHILSAKLRGSGFLWIKRKVEADEADRIRSLKLDWVELREEMRRFYTRGELASHVVGSTGIVDGEVTERGNAGIELQFDEELAGRSGEDRVYTDVKQNAYDSVVERKPEPGDDITLSIDSNLQYVAERELDKAIDSSGAKTGSIVAVNPYTGDILAMANYPRFDPNLPPGPNEPPNARSNLAITTPFEPGSVFKVITLSAALETTQLRPDTMINCGTSIKVYDRTIKDEHGHGAYSMADVLAHSSNVGAAMIGQKVGNSNLYKYQRKFGFGEKTGIDLPGESAGLLRHVEDWSATSGVFLSIGHEVAVTSLQLALAGAVIANGGILVKPRLVLARQTPGQPEERFAPEKGQQIIDPATTIQMRQMMEGVVLRGTAKGYANLRGYTSGGKTGTAQIFDLKAHVYTHNYNASFLGFAPLQNPQIVIIVTLEGTSGGTAGFGAPVAAPVFREVAMAALRMLDVPKDLPDAPVTASVEPAPDAVALSTQSAPTRLALTRPVSSVTQPPVQADALAVPGSADSSKGGNLDRRPFFAPSTPSGSGPKVPDFRGMTLRAVLEESSAEGLAVEVAGNGVAQTQVPPPGAELPPNTRVRVQFAR
ncbi:MAG TPA: penicillin-binding protein [Bryobacteraceae bacterium]